MQYIKDGTNPKIWWQLYMKNGLQRAYLALDRPLAYPSEGWSNPDINVEFINSEEFL